MDRRTRERSATRSTSTARRVLFMALAVALGVGAAVGGYGVSVQPGAAIVRAVFEARPEVTPPDGFGAVRRAVRATTSVTLRHPGVPRSRLDLFAPEHAVQGAPVVLWVHGGGFVSSSANTVRDYAILLAARGYLVASLDYSIAPGARYPTPVVQGNVALRWLHHHAAGLGGDPSRVFIGGDSAGAQIASELAAVQTDPGLAAALHVRPGADAAAVRGVILFCGLYDMRTVARTGFPALRTYLWAYTGTRTWTDFRDIDQLSTTRTATAAYPPTFISVGDADPFRSQATELTAALRAQHVPVSTLFWTDTRPGLGHEYQFDFRTPQAAVALERTTRFIDDRSTR